jgi:hypothetical protein
VEEEEEKEKEKEEEVSIKMEESILRFLITLGNLELNLWAVFATGGMGVE